MTDAGNASRWAHTSQKEIQTGLTKPDAIGMGLYNSDSHNVQRYVTEVGHAPESKGSDRMEAAGKHNGRVSVTYQIKR